MVGIGGGTQSGVCADDQESYNGQTYKMLHFYIHSFRFAQGTKRNENGLPERIFFFIILLIGNSVYYKSRGGEWAVRPAG